MFTTSKRASAGPFEGRYEVRVLASSNPTQSNISGKVIDETRNMLTIETKKGIKTVAKGDCTFSFHLPTGEWVKVEGKLLESRPEDRVKKKFKKW